MSSPVESLVNREYKYGFVTDIEADVAPKGLSEDIIRLISAKKQEPAWLLEWRLKAYRGWLKMTEPHHWPNITLHRRSTTRRSSTTPRREPPSRWAASTRSTPSCSRPTRSSASRSPSRRSSPASRSTRSSTRSRSAPPTRPSSPSRGSSSAPSARRCGSIPSWSGSTSARWCPASDNFFAALNAAVFSDGSFVYVPKGVRCPMELSTYFRINAADTGQFERTLIVADEGAYVSYLEGCTAPKRDENQLHAAVVELVALEGATIKYSTVQNWYAGDEEGRGGIYNFVTKRGKCAGADVQDLLDPGGDRVGHHLEVSQRDPPGRRLGRRVLLGGGGERPAAGRHRHQDDPHGEEHPQHDRVQGHLRRAGAEQLPRPGEGAAEGGGRPELHPVRLDADREPLRRAHVPLHRRAERRPRPRSTRRRRRRSARTRSST